MLQELDGKVAVITGGGSGIGASLARAVRGGGRCGSSWSTSTRSGPPRVAAELPTGTAVARAVDVADAAAVQALADFAFDTFGAVHLLCNNAGISPAGRIWDFTDDEWQTLLGVNVRGVANGIRSFVPRMIDQGEGHIVNTGSGASFVVDASASGPTRATKHAIVGLSEGAALRARGHRHRGERARPRGREHEHRRLDGPPLGDRPRRDRRRLHGAHRRARRDLARDDRARRGRRRHARRRPRGLGLHRDGARASRSAWSVATARSSTRTGAARSASPSSRE